MSRPANFGRIVVHGHTPGVAAEFKPNRIGVDTGAYRTGVLSCLFVNSDGVRLSGTGKAPA
jgi:serine/threonine protein phosphatase 1